MKYIVSTSARIHTLNTNFWVEALCFIEEVGGYLYIDEILVLNEKDLTLPSEILEFFSDIIEARFLKGNMKLET